MKKGILFTLAVMAALSFSLQDSLAYKKIRCFMLQPPGLNLTGYKTLGVFNFTGELGNVASDQLITALVDDKRGIKDVEASLWSSGRKGVSYQNWATTRVFKLIERNELDRIMKEKQMGQGGIVTDDQAVSVAQILGIDAIITGSATPSFQRSSKVVTRTYTDYNTGAEYQKNVEVITHKAEATVKLKVLSVKDGQILGQKEAYRKYEASQDAADQSKLLSEPTAKEQCIRQAMGELVNYISPYFAGTDRELSKVKAKEFKDKADNAAELAENGDLDKAFAHYKIMYDQDQYNPEILYNLGIINEVVGNFDDAQAMFDAAVALNAEEKDYQNGARRAAAYLAYVETLQSLGVPYAKHEWATAGVETRDKITVKGSNKERQEVKAEANEGSAVIAKVPGGIQVVMLECNGDWYKVELPDKKVGYLHKKQVKQ